MHHILFTQILLSLSLLFSGGHLIAQDTPGSTLNTDSTESAAESGQEITLELLYAKAPKTEPTQKLEIPMILKKYDAKQTHKNTEKKLYHLHTNNHPNRKIGIQADHSGSKYRMHQRKIAQERQKNIQKYRERALGSLFGKLLDLDWIMVGIAVFLPALLIALLYFLLGGTALTFIEMFLFALGFGFSIFSYIYLLTELDPADANYRFFIKFGLFTWPGILAIIAGFVGLFGGTGGSLFAYLIVGLVIGLISFLLSLFFKNSLLNGF
ncbi:MAG: hypothetical protein NW226_10855 [Microscillaceae bacterium]|nr:hypothetical protein [Microscillaceae bacterium]